MCVCLTGQAVVTLQLCILHGPLLLICQRGGLGDAQREGGQRLGAGVRISQHPAQPLNLQQSAVVLAYRLSVLLLFVTLGTLALEVQCPSHDVSGLAVGRLLEHGSGVMPLLQELLLVSGIFGPAAAAGRLSAVLEPRRAPAAAVSLAAFTAIIPGHHAHLRRYLIVAPTAPRIRREISVPLQHLLGRSCVFACRSCLLRAQSYAMRSLSDGPFPYFSPPTRRLVNKSKTITPTEIFQQEERRLDISYR